MRGSIAGACALAIAWAATVRAEPKHKVDPIAAAAAKACDLPLERITPTEAATDRKPAADAEQYDTDWLWYVGDDRVKITDDDGDGRADQRERELYHPGSDGLLDCEIDERWSHGRWHLATVSRFDGADEITTAFANDRPTHVDRHSAIIQ